MQSVARAERLFVVPAGAFHPRPKVDSAVLRLTPRPTRWCGRRARARFRRLVVGLFGFRRKQIARGLRELTGWAPDPVAEALARAGIPPTVRPEMLAPPVFAALLEALVDWDGCGA